MAWRRRAFARVQAGNDRGGQTSLGVSREGTARWRARCSAHSTIAWDGLCICAPRSPPADEMARAGNAATCRKGMCTEQ